MNTKMAEIPEHITAETLDLAIETLTGVASPPDRIPYRIALTRCIEVVCEANHPEEEMLSLCWNPRKSQLLLLNAAVCLANLRARHLEGEPLSIYASAGLCALFDALESVIQGNPPEKIITD